MDFDEVSASPAYSSLDELAESGRLTQVQVQLYKSKFAKLHQVVLKTYENEKILLKKAKQLNGDLGNERAKLEEAATQAEADSERVAQLRTEVRSRAPLWARDAARRLGVAGRTRGVPLQHRVDARRSRPRARCSAGGQGRCGADDARGA